MKTKRKPLALAIASITAGCLLQAGAVSAQELHESVHVFSIEDLQVDFHGTLYGQGGVAQDTSAICGLGSLCPGSAEEGDPQPFVDKQGVTLYPIDTTFGFNVVDFVGAEEKTDDGVYTEGWVGNIEEGGEVIGIKISNAETDTYKVKPPLGTWCQGLGGTSIKCSTEHYTVMEHVLTCNETIPYFYASEDGIPGYLQVGEDSLYCDQAALDDMAYIIKENEKSEELLTSVVPGEGGQIDANDNTTVFRDIATSFDYSITLKDDGKPLYRWGSLIKRPNDVRLYARLELPEEWTAEDAPAEGYEVNDAKLYVTHWITNNPNDQLRPEDLENEAATGRKPSYYVDGDDWRSLRDCYEGDADVLEGLEGTPIEAGTLFKNNSFAQTEGFSSDLRGALTNAYYTSVDRDPFEWSYIASEDVFFGRYDFQGYGLPLEDPASMGLELVSGPRWRLKANKFGQDIPGLEIPAINCSMPPYGHDNIKYEVGTPVTTVINLLDWAGGEENSPLRNSNGWIDLPRDTEGLPLVECQDIGGQCVTSNGVPMTDGFDLAVYIKGDRKPTALFSAKLVINGEGILPPVMPDLEIYKPKAPNNIFSGKESSVEVWVALDDNSQAVGNGSVQFTGVGETGYVYLDVVKPFEELLPGDKTMVKVPFIAPPADDIITWTMTLLVNGVAVETAPQVQTVVKLR